MRSFHYILLEIELEKGVVTVLDSRRKDCKEYAEITEMLANKFNRLYIGNFVHFLISGNNYFLCIWQGLETIYPNTSESSAEGTENFIPESKYY